MLRRLSTKETKKQIVEDEHSGDDAKMPEMLRVKF